MTKAIISSSVLLMKLQQLNEKSQYVFDFKKDKNELWIEDALILCECNSTCAYVVDYSRVQQLIIILKLLQEQPITIAIGHSGWLYVKELAL